VCATNPNFYMEIPKKNCVLAFSRFA